MRRWHPAGFQRGTVPTPCNLADDVLRCRLTSHERKAMKVRISYEVEVPTEDLSPILDGAIAAAADLQSQIEAQIGYDVDDIDEGTILVEEIKA